MSTLELFGEDFTAYGLERGRRPAQPLAIRLTDRDLDVLRFVADFGAASSSSLAELFWPVYSSRTRVRLKQLHDAGYLDRVRPRLPRTLGTHQWLYRLAPLGWAALVDLSRAPQGTRRAVNVRRVAALEHDTLAVELLVSLARRSRARWHPDTNEPLRSLTPFEWMGPRTGRVDLLAPDELPRGENQAVLQPDLTLLGTTRGGARVALLYELDRTARAVKQRTKLERYDRFLADWQNTRHDDLDLAPGVVFILPGQQHLPGFLRVADQQLTIQAGNGYPGREQIAFTTRQLIAAGTWQGWQVPRQPPSQRRDPLASATLGPYPGPEELFVPPSAQPSTAC